MQLVTMTPIYSMFLKRFISLSLCFDTRPPFSFPCNCILFTITMLIKQPGNLKDCNIGYRDIDNS